MLNVSGGRVVMMPVCKADESEKLLSSFASSFGVDLRKKEDDRVMVPFPYVSIENSEKKGFQAFAAQFDKHSAMAETLATLLLRRAV